MNWLNHAAVNASLDRIGWMLLHSLWLIAAAAGLLAIVLWALPRSAAKARYAAACAVMAMIVLVLPATLWLAPEAALQPIAKPPTLAMATEFSGAANTAAAMPAVSASSPSDLPAPFLAAPDAAGQPHWDWAATVRPWLPCLAAAWSLGVLLVGVWHIGGFVAVGRMRRVGASAPPAWVVKMATELAERLQVRRAVRVLLSTLADTPAVIGYWAPVVLVPAGLIAGMPPAQLRSLLAHELAHIRRGDYLVNLLQTVIESLLFYHPCVWWIGRQIRNERESCCDDLAIVATGDRIAYARALAAVAEAQRHQLFPNRVALAAKGGSLMFRIRRMLTPSGSFRPTRCVPSAIVGVLLLAGMCVAVTCYLGLPAMAESQPQAGAELQLAEDAPALIVVESDKPEAKPRDVTLEIAPSTQPWPMPKPGAKRELPDLVLNVNNGTDNDIWFMVGADTKLILTDAAGRKLEDDGGQNGEAVPRPLWIPAGKSESFHYTAYLTTPVKGKLPSLVVSEPTGYVHVYHKLKPGTYKLKLSYRNSELKLGSMVRGVKDNKGLSEDTPLWIGKLTTPETKFELAEEPAESAAKPDVATASNADVTALVKQLSSDDYGAREAAAKKLIEIGKPAQTELERAAKSNDPEVAVRAQRILKQLRGEVTLKGTAIPQVDHNAIVDRKKYAMILDVVDQDDRLTRYAVEANDLARKYVGKFGGATGIIVTGTVREEGGLKILTPTVIKIGPIPAEPKAIKAEVKTPLKSEPAAKAAGVAAATEKARADLEAAEKNLERVRAKSAGPTAERVKAAGEVQRAKICLEMIGANDEQTRSLKREIAMLDLAEAENELAQLTGVYAAGGAASGELDAAKAEVRRAKLRFEMIGADEKQTLALKRDLASVDVVLAEQKYQHLTRLSASGAVATSEVDAAKAEVRRAKLRFEMIGTDEKQTLALKRDLASVDVEQAEQTFDRLTKLSASGVVPVSELEAAKAEVQRAKLRMEMIDAREGQMAQLTRELAGVDLREAEANLRRVEALMQHAAVSAEEVEAARKALLAAREKHEKAQSAAGGSAPAGSATPPVKPQARQDVSVRIINTSSEAEVVGEAGEADAWIAKQITKPDGSDPKMPTRALATTPWHTPNGEAKEIYQSMQGGRKITAQLIRQDGKVTVRLDGRAIGKVPRDITLADKAGEGVVVKLTDYPGERNLYAAVRVGDGPKQEK